MYSVSCILMKILHETLLTKKIYSDFLNFKNILTNIFFLYGYKQSIHSILKLRNLYLNFRRQK